MESEKLKTDPEAGLNTSPPPPDYGAHTEEVPPPSYDDTAKDAPPSYIAVFGQMQDMKKNSSGPGDFIQKLVKFLMNTVAVTIFMAITLAVPIVMIVLGSIHINDCPVERKIPIYLIVMGSVYIVKNLLDLLVRCRTEEGEDPQAHNSPANSISRLLGCFMFGFFIAGNVWIYSNYPPSENPGSNRYCNPVVYYFAFWTTTLVYIFSSLACCFICCAALGTAGTTDDPS